MKRESIKALPCHAYQNHSSFIVSSVGRSLPTPTIPENLDKCTTFSPIICDALLAESRSRETPTYVIYSLDLYRRSL